MARTDCSGLLWHRRVGLRPVGLSERGQDMGTLQQKILSDPNQDEAPRFPG